jgi:hypothetical protein
MDIIFYLKLRYSSLIPKFYFFIHNFNYKYSITLINDFSNFIFSLAIFKMFQKQQIKDKH